MRLLPMVAVVLLVAAPARADKRLDKAVEKSERQLAEGKVEDAVKTLEKVASRSERDPEASLALADLLLRLGRLADAGTALVEAGDRIAAAPPAVRARVLAARSAFALRKGTVQDALDLARQAAEAGPEGLAALARAQARAGDPEAPATAAEAVSATPDSALAHVASGDAFLARGLGQKAEAAYRRASEIEPDSALALSGLARALAAQGRAAEALEAARAATAADEHSAGAVAALGIAVLAADPKDASSEAAAAVQQAKFLEPENAFVRLDVGRVFERRQQLEMAATAYLEAGALDLTWAAPQLARLALLLREGDAQAALAGLEALPEEMKATGRAALLQGRALLETGDAAAATAALDRAAAALPGSAEVHAAHGDAAEVAGDFAVAADAYGRAVESAPGNTEYRTRHADLLVRAGRPDEALPALLEVASRPGGRTAETLIALGSVYRSLDPPRVEDAVAAYQEALSLDPANGDAALGIAHSYRAGRQWQRAIDAYDRVPKVDPRRKGESILGVAWTFCQRKDLYKARFFAREAAQAGAEMREIRRALENRCGAS